MMIQGSQDRLTTCGLVVGSIAVVPLASTMGSLCTGQVRLPMIVSMTRASRAQAATIG